MKLARIQFLAGQYVAFDSASNARLGHGDHYQGVALFFRSQGYVIADPAVSSRYARILPVAIAHAEKLGGSVDRHAMIWHLVETVHPAISHNDAYEAINDMIRLKEFSYAYTIGKLLLNAPVVTAQHAFVD